MRTARSLPYVFRTAAIWLLLGALHLGPLGPAGWLGASGAAEDCGAACPCEAGDVAPDDPEAAPERHDEHADPGDGCPDGCPDCDGGLQAVAVPRALGLAPSLAPLGPSRLVRVEGPTFSTRAGVFRPPRAVG